MSFNQSWAEKTEGHLRKTGRSGSSGHPRGFSGTGKGGAAAAPLQSFSSNAQALSSNRGFKKSGNVQVVQPRVNPASTGLDSSAAFSGNVISRTVQNGATAQPPSHVSSDAQAPTGSRQVDASRNSKMLPKAPPAQSGVGASEAEAPVTPAKGDASKQFTLQFGSISPGIVNGMQIPARTSSAPPNLDEQKRDQAHCDSSQSVPTLPLPAAPRPLKQTTKGVGVVKQTSHAESLHQTQARKAVHATAPIATSMAIPKSSVLPVPGSPMPLPFQQPQVPLQFGGPNLQMQAQGVTASSLQMPLTLPVGGVPQVPQQMFVPGLQHHPMQPQAIMHQGQGFGFVPQISHQLPSQLGNMGIAVGPQFTQQPGKFGAQRKSTVKITHPDTHEELRLDKRTDSYMDGSSSTQRPPGNPTQSQPLPTFPPSHQMNYYPSLQPTSYGPSPIVYPSATSVPMSSAQLSSQAPRHGYSMGQSGQTMSFLNSSAMNHMGSGNTKPFLPHVVPEAVKSEFSSVSAAPSSVQVTIKPPIGLDMDKVGASSVMNAALISNAEAPKVLNPSLSQQNGNEIRLDNTVQRLNSVPEPSSNLGLPVTDRQPTASSAALSMEREQPQTSSAAPAPPLREPVDVAPGAEGNMRDSIRRSDSLKEQQKKQSKKDLKHTQSQQSDIVSSGSVTVLHSSQATEDKSRNISSRSEDRAAEVIENEAMSMHQESARVVLEKQASEDVPPGSSDASKLNMLMVSTLENDSSEISTSSALHDDEIISNDLCSDLSRSDHSLVDVTTGMLDSGELDRDKVSNNPLKDSNDTKLYPNSTITEFCQSEEPITSVDQEVAGEEDFVRQPHDDDMWQLDISKECVELDGKTEELDTSATTALDIMCAKLKPSSHFSSATDMDKYILKTSETISCQDVGLQDPSVPLPEDASVQAPVSTGTGQKHGVMDLHNGNPVTVTLSGPKEKLPLEPGRAKTATGRKKKRREILLKADAAGSSDLYNAYKGPEENHEAFSTPESLHRSLKVDLKDDSVNGVNQAVGNEEDEPSKDEVDDWEDAADISTLKLRASENGYQGYRAKKQQDGYGNETTGKKYSRDFLLTFSEQCTQLPVCFEIGSDIANTLLSGPVGTSYMVEPHSSPGRSMDRSFGGPRSERRMVGAVDDKWSKSPDPIPPGQDIRLDTGHGAPAFSFRPGHGTNHGLLRNPRGQSSSQNAGGIFSGPPQSMHSSGWVVRNGADADRWQRASSAQRGLIPSPQSPMQLMHKAAKKYEVGKISDEEEAKQRQLKAILNKLTPQNFEKLFVQVKEVNIDNANTLKGVISQIFDKALMEPTFCEMYANFCYHLADELPDFIEDNEKITFKRLLLNKCQEEFERGEREQAEANKVEEEGEIQQSEEEREEKRIKARRRMLGNIRLIGELYKKRMLTEKIMHECIKKLLGQHQYPDEEDLEALCKLMSTIGEMIDHPKAKEHMDAYFDMMLKLSTNRKLSSRVRFMLKDVIDLRKNMWQQRRKVEGPKKIEEVHRDAAHERQAQATRLSRGPVISSTPRRGAPIDYGHKGPTILSSASQSMGGSRGFPPQVRGYGTQDVRLENRHLFDSRTPSVPLPQRPTDDYSITLGPQGGLAKGMSIRGQSVMSNASSLDEISSGAPDARRSGSGPNGYSPTPYNSREITSRHMQERMTGVAHDHPNLPDRRAYSGSRESIPADRAYDKISSTGLSSGRTQGSIIAGHDVASEAKPLCDKVLRDKSISAIREYYSAKDEQEVALCIKELNSPSFYPTMVSLWVTDSFERADKERDLLANLLVSLNKSQDSILSQLQLTEGFESVLSSLEDAVNDAPKAAEFFGRLLARVILENVIPFREIGRLIHDGGEEPGRLLEVGLASEVLGSILDFIKMEKGDSVLNEIRANSSLWLEDFLPPHPF